MEQPDVFVAVLVKQKEAVLPLFLESLEAWDYPKEKLFLYIRTNNIVRRRCEKRLYNMRNFFTRSTP